MVDILKVWKEHNGRCSFKVSMEIEIAAIRSLIGHLEGKQVNVYAIGYKYDALLKVIPNNVIKYTEMHTTDVSAFCSVFTSLDFIHAFYIASVERCKSKYILGFTKLDVPIKLRALIPLVTDLDTNTYCENNFGVEFNPEDQTRFDNINDAMTETIGIFDNNYENLIACIQGSTVPYKSPYDFREEFARSRGWEPDLDLSVHMFAEIDKYYNPSSLFERATHYQTLIADRERLLSVNKAKVDTVNGLITYLIGRQVLVLSKNGSFGEQLDELRLKRGNLSHNIHSSMKSIPLLDESTGGYILCKSGNNKGQPKMFGETVLTRLMVDKFNAKAFNWLCITGSIDKKVSILDVDVLIITSYKTLAYHELKARIAGLTFKKYPSILNVVMLGTKEQETVTTMQKKFSIAAHTFLSIPEVTI